MKALILQHASFEKPGYILEWLKNRQFSIKTLPLYESQCVFPPSCQADILIIMGGPMSVHDEKKYPWLIQEKLFIKQAIEEGIPILGICLGAQLIASVYDAPVKPALQKEIGWFPIHSLSYPFLKELQWPEQFFTYLWHGEQFDIPKDGVLLAYSQACPHQAFILKDHVIALQFHPEITPSLIQEMAKHGAADKKNSAPFVQSTEQMLSVPEAYFQQNHVLVDHLLSYLLK